MKKNSMITLAGLMGLLLTFTGCSVIEGIFKAGVWVGVLMVVAVIGGIIFLISRMGKK
jgi:hypothetical protein